jgi:hypothetical protein
MAMEQIYQRLESLIRTQERHSAILQELQRRMDGVEGMRKDLQGVEQALTRLEGRLEGILGQTKTWQNLVWGILSLLLGGIIGAALEMFRK